MAGKYGEKNVWEDAKVTVTEFLDNFYDESNDNYNQAFCELERRLQEYFGYEARGEDPKHPEPESPAKQLARVKEIIESDELCAEAMVSEIGEIVKTEL